MSGRSPKEVETVERRTNWTLILLVAGVLLLIAVVVYFATRGNSDQDKLTNAEIVRSTPPPSEEKRCAGAATYDGIKRELFREAAELRGHDQTTYDTLAGFAVLRIDNPVMESQDAATGMATCSGSVSIELPPGVAFENGGRSLMSDLDYRVDASGKVALNNAAGLAAPLARIVRTAPPPAPAVTGDTNNVAPQNDAVPVPPQPAPPPEPQPPPQPPR